MQKQLKELNIKKPNGIKNGQKFRRDFFQTRQTNGQQEREEMLDIINHQNDD